LIFLVGFAVAGCRGQGDMGELIEEAYMAVQLAAGSGGDVTELVSLLNAVIEEVGRGGYDAVEVEARLEALIAAAEAAGVEGVEAGQSRLLAAGAQAMVAVVLSVADWRYFPGVFWGMWLRVRGGWVVEEP